VQTYAKLDEGNQYRKVGCHYSKGSPMAPRGLRLPPAEVALLLIAAGPSYSSNGGREMPTELRKPPEREATDLERYGRWQDLLMFIGLLLLGAAIAKWLWKG
jgi:hypothetical protein